MVAFLLACTSVEKDTAVYDEPTEQVVVRNALQPPLEDVEWLSEAFTDLSDFVPLSVTRSLQNGPQGTMLVDAFDDSSVLLGQYTKTAGVEYSDGSLLLALDGEVWAYQEQQLLPFDVPLPIPVDELFLQQDTVWMLGLGRLFRWEDDMLTEVSFPDYPYIYSFSVTENRLYVSVPWLLEVDLSSAAMTVLAKTDHTVDSMSIDRNDRLWFVEDQELKVYISGDEAVVYDFGEDIISVMGPDLWIQGVQTTFRYRDGTFARLEMSAGEWLAIDDLGRLLQRDNGEVLRNSIDRPVVVAGLSMPLLVRETVRLLPSAPQSVSEVRVWIDGVELDVSVAPWTVTLDPELLGSGSHTLRSYCMSTLGDTVDTQVVWVGDLPEVVWSEVEALSQEHCLACHAGDTVTDLRTKDDWERHIDSIIEEVSIQMMPLGGPYLSDEEIVLIRGWKEGGFQ